MVHWLLEEENKEVNCPICLEAITPGEQVLIFEDGLKDLPAIVALVCEFYPKVLEPGCDASHLHAGHVDCYEKWLRRSHCYLFV